MFELTGFQRDILYCIAAMEDPYGLKIKRKLEDATSLDINHGRLYPNLDSLVELGLVQKEQKDKRTNLYLLSEQGSRLLEERRQWEDEKLQDTKITLNWICSVFVFTSSVRKSTVGLVDRLLPGVAANSDKLLKTPLNVDDPMCCSEIIETAGISGSSYDRYINELAAWDFIGYIGGGRSCEVDVSIIK